MPCRLPRRACQKRTFFRNKDAACPAVRSCPLLSADDLFRHYTFSEADLSIIRQRRGPANRWGEIRGRSFGQQRYRASGLNLVTAAIVLRDTG